jgi:hypothetical protein
MSNEKVVKPSSPSRTIWITLEATEIIELKRIAIDHDATGAVAFFRDAVAPRVIAAARQRGVAIDLLEEDENNEHLPG